VAIVPFCSSDLGHQLKTAGRRCHYLHLAVTRDDDLWSKICGPDGTGTLLEA
jgi:hypothetical protein